MPPNDKEGTKLFQQDIVEKISFPGQYGIVLRCWHDAEDVPPSVPPLDPLMRPLSYGEFGVTFLTNEGEREILHQSNLRLVDRTLQPGDYCKRSFDDIMAGVVTNIKVKGHLAHAISGQKLEGYRTLEDIEDKADAEIGDYVAYDDWIGQVIEVFDESVVQTASGLLVRLPELSSRLAVGECGRNILPPPPSEVQNLFSVLQPTDEGKETVIGVKHTVYAVAWLALNQSLDPIIAADKQRPKRFWYGRELDKLTLIRGRSDQEMRVGDRVHLKNPTGYPYTEHGKEEDPTGVVRVQTFLVTETVTQLDVLWQDGTHEFVNATSVIPYLNPDEYDCWPGDQVIWKNEEGVLPAIVQSVNATDRTALILLPDTGNIELAPLLELDAHGGHDNDVNNVHNADGFGVRRGDFVFIHKPGTTNGLEPPKVPRIGEIEPWVRENPFSESTLSGWRKEMHEIGYAHAIAQDLPAEQLIKKPVPGDGKLLWCGEVTEVNLDGTVQVTCPDWSVGTYDLRHLTRLYDGIEQLEDDAWDGGSGGMQSDTDEDETEQQWAMDQDGIWRPELPSDDWEDLSSTQDEDENGMHVEEIDVMDIMEIENIVSEAEDIEPEVQEIEQAEPQPQHQETAMEQSTSIAEVSQNSTTSMPVSEENDFDDSTQWSRFEILSSAPPDHAFYASPPAQPSKTFLGRLNKEYRALKSSLPESIIVRAYEDRTDLLRCLIIGPDNTPYQDAPFVIDWMLDSNFPHSPPIAHFLSWTNGNGRVNPNLYEEGKVCLSILGTWSGEKSEVWSAARSSLLQAFVSIQGLVLVKEPWFCEPAYEKLRGTEEGTINSRLYSEKAYVLSRGFVRRALEIPLGGLQSEIHYLYYTKHRLQRVISDAEYIINRSRNHPELSAHEHDLAVPRLTAGGIIALERTLNKLRSLLQNLPSIVTSS
ncbi:hypothetical protein BDN70DRAFT_878485 [Pholiota conissans]|uniref:UBC core domain-containing protein n=1 Tax=Pholiota conissans TaxID=109636 RepID=A0A9P6D1I6_9AGAR|nr:hypothetical protein BDN70DRAFT_878485 [Pholiota conissans]